MFDWYEPVPALACPVCQSPLTEWQGKDAANLLYVWRQDQAAPVDWRVDDEVQIPGASAAARLPATFSIAAWDDAGHEVVAEGSAPDGIWTTTQVLAVLDARASRKGARFTRLLWGSAPWLTKVARDR